MRQVRYTLLQHYRAHSDCILRYTLESVQRLSLPALRTELTHSGFQDRGHSSEPVPTSNHLYCANVTAVLSTPLARPVSSV